MKLPLLLLYFDLGLQGMLYSPGMRITNLIQEGETSSPWRTVMSPESGILDYHQDITSCTTIFSSFSQK